MGGFLPPLRKYPWGRCCRSCFRCCCGYCCPLRKRSSPRPCLNNSSRGSLAQHSATECVGCDVLFICRERFNLFAVTESCIILRFFSPRMLHMAAWDVHRLNLGTQHLRTRPSQLPHLLCRQTRRLVRSLRIFDRLHTEVPSGHAFNDP